MTYWMKSLTLLLLAGALPLGCTPLRQPVPGNDLEEAEFPLTPLSAKEISLAVDLVHHTAEVQGPVSFPYVGLLEPSKRSVQQFRAKPSGAAPFERRAEVITFNQALGVSYRAIIDVRTNKLEQLTRLAGVQPPFLNEEGIYPAEILRQDTRFQEAMRKRGITDLSKVHIEVWMAPDDPAAQGCAHRIVKGIPFYQEEVIGNKYARPIEGVIGTMRLDGDESNPKPRVLSVVDTGIRPVPTDPADFMAPVAVSEAQAQVPAGAPHLAHPTVRVHNHLIEWDNWRLRYGMHPREGLILYTVQFRSGDQWKDVLYRGSVSEFVVPYGDPEKSWEWRNAFDEGEYGLGKLSFPLHKGKETPPDATMLDAVFADDAGKPTYLPGIAAAYEHDRGILWTHTNWLTGDIRSERDRILVLQFNANLSNYDYLFRWVFTRDGSIEFYSDMTGVMLPKGTDSRSCSVCSATEFPGLNDRFGRIVAPGVIGVNHQHFVNVRLDLDVAGEANSLEEIALVPAPREGSNAFTVQQRRIDREGPVAPKLAPSGLARWKVLNRGAKNSLGHFNGYMIHGDPLPPLLPGVTAPVRKRASFVNPQLWISRYHDGELYASGTFGACAKKTEGLPVFTYPPEWVDQGDLVLWYNLGISHMPRPEEWPVMPAAHVGLRLSPDGFLDRNPTIESVRKGNSQ